MEVRVVVEPEGGAAVDVVVVADPGAPSQRLLEELALHLGRPPRTLQAAQCERTGTWLAGDLPVQEAGLCDGDRLLLAREMPPDGGDAGEADGDALVDLVVVGGPGSGTRVGLAAGRHLVGRGPGADVVLDDRSMSRRHFAVEVGAATVTVSDARSSNGTFVRGRPVDAPHELAEDEVVEAGRTLIAFASRSARPRPAGAGAGGRVVFNRPPRVMPQPVGRAIAVPAPPARGEPPGLSFGPLLLPLVLGVGMFAATGSPLMLMISALSPALAVWSFAEGRRRTGRGRNAAEREFHAAVERAAAAVQSARADERRARDLGAPDAARLRTRVEELSPDLWERRTGDPDFLSLRVGVADLPSAVRVELAPGGPPDLRAAAEERLERDATLVAAPVTLSLAGGLAGLAGHRGRRDALARWLLAQAAVLHSPGELRIAAAVPEERVVEWEWLKWLPHVAATELAAGPARAGELLERLASSEGGATLVLLDGELELDRGRLGAALAAGVAGIWLGREPRELPGECTHVLELAHDVARLRLTDVRAGSRLDDMAADGVPLAYAEELARRLAPVRDTASPDAATVLPERVSLLDLLDLAAPTAAAIERRWAAGDARLSAPVGLSRDGPFCVAAGRDDGLRLLVGGMPGAGKSELLQTMIAALAASHPPDRLAFLLVDYKGGAAFQECSSLPHTAGLLTDLDEGLAERCRVSLVAELRRREQILRDAGARNLRELARRDPALAPPALIVIVDEFATLAREMPAFVETAVDVAQRGRSLGLHLVLATQRPRGAVNDNIRANTNLRIAMRVGDAGDSRDIIEAPDAAAIPAEVPGRAVALTGRGPGGEPELTVLQAAYVGGRSRNGAGDGEAVTVRAFRFGERAAPRPRVLSTIAASAPTDLQAVVAAAREAARALGIPAATAPWPPPLPLVVPLDDLPEAPRGHAVIGLLDEPARQRQRPCTLALDRDGGMLVLGASGAGKTTLLRTVAVSLARGSSPRDVQIYGLDFASRGLGSLEALPHCGSVIAGDDDERVQRLLTGLRQTLAHRRAQLAEGREVAGMTRIVLLLDGYAAFAATYERVHFGDVVQTVTRLAAEGRSLGIHVVISADRRADVPGALAGVISGRIVLRMADDDDYATLGIGRNAVAGDALPPGRGFTREGTLVQVAHVASGRYEELCRELAAAWPDGHARPVGRLRSSIERGDLPAPSAPLRAVVGIEDEQLAPVEIDLSGDSFLVAGPHRSGRSTALATIAASLWRGGGPPVHLLVPRRSPLARLDGWADVARGPEACLTSAGRLAAAAGPLVVVIDDAEELAEGAAAAPLGELLRRGRDEQVRLVAAVEGRAAQRLFGGWLRDLRGAQHGLLLQAESDVDGDLLGVRLPRRGPASLPPGRGWLAQEGLVRLVQVAWDGPSASAGQ